MAESISSGSLVQGIHPEIARRRIETFRQRFKEPHFYFAQHAAFPLALTPDLLYRLWANFQRNIYDEKLKVPWIAVADLLLSPLCEEVDVGYELYEMDMTIRTLLLNDLKANPRFSKKRIDELSSFLQDYALQQLKSSDPVILDTARGQRWTALAYTRPGEVIRELAKALTVLYKKNAVEQVRITSLMETLGALAEPLAALEGFAPLLAYAQGIANLVLGHEDTEKTQPISAKETRLVSDMEQRFLVSLIDDWIQFTEEKWRTASDSQLGWKPLRSRWSNWDDVFQDTYAAKTSDPLSQVAQAAGDTTARRYETSKDKGSAASAVACFLCDIMVLRIALNPAYTTYSSIGQGPLSSLLDDWIQFTEEKWRTISDAQLGWKPLRSRWSNWDDIFKDTYAAKTSDPLSQAAQAASDATARRYETSKDKGSAASAVACFLCDIMMLRTGIKMLTDLHGLQTFPTDPAISIPPQNARRIFKQESQGSDDRVEWLQPKKPQGMEQDLAFNDKEDNF